MRPKEVVLKWLEAFNGADAAAISTLYAEFATSHQVADTPVNGREAIRAMFGHQFAATEMLCVPDNIFEDGDWAILEWYSPQGLRGCGFFHVIADQIVYQRGYWDKLSFLRLHNSLAP